jgi:hypothetical protein
MVTAVVIYLHLGCKQVYKTDAGDVSNWVRLNKLAVKTYAFVLGIFSVLVQLAGVDAIDTLLWRKLLGNIGSSGSSDASADDNEPSELILDSIQS